MSRVTAFRVYARAQHASVLGEVTQGENVGMMYAPTRTGPIFLFTLGQPRAAARGNSSGRDHATDHARTTPEEPNSVECYTHRGSFAFLDSIAIRSHEAAPVHLVE